MKKDWIGIWAGLVVPAAGVAVLFYQSAAQFARGEDADRDIRQLYFGPIDLFDDLSPLSTDGSPIRITVGTGDYSNLSIYQVILRNEGDAPLKPSDFVEPLRIEVTTPWEIVAIRDGMVFRKDPVPNQARLKWERVDAQHFEAAPFLLNPGVATSQRVYLTYRGQSDIPRDEVPVSLSLGVPHLTGFYRGPTKYDDSDAPAMVYLSATAVVFVIVVASVLLAWYAWALLRLGYVRRIAWTSVALIVFCGWLSYAAAEVIAYSVFEGNPATEWMRGRDYFFDWRVNLENWIVAVLNLSVVGVFIKKLLSGPKL
jgi:hypothetical protein